MNFFTKSAWSVAAIALFSQGRASAQPASDSGTKAPSGTAKSGTGDLAGPDAGDKGAEAAGGAEGELARSGSTDAPAGEHRSPPGVEATPVPDSGEGTDKTDSAAVASEPASKADTIAACLSQHERAQLARLSGGFRESMRELKACADPQCPEAVRNDCLTWRHELNSVIPTIIVAAEGDAGDLAVAKVSVDGEVLRTELDGRPIVLDPGTHLIKVELPDGSTREQQIVLSEGDRGRRIAFSFRSPPTELPQIEYAKTMTIRPVPPGVYILGATAFVGLGVAVGFGSDAWSKSRTARDVCAPLCDADVSRAVTERAAVADIALGVALASTIGAVVVYSYRAERVVPVERVAIDWRPGPRGGEFGIRGAF